eukprot:Polyplicarium_translucidae@DN333_c0_g1_i1.p2
MSGVKIRFFHKRAIGEQVVKLRVWLPESNILAFFVLPRIPCNYESPRIFAQQVDVLAAEHWIHVSRYVDSGATEDVRRKHAQACEYRYNETSNARALCNWPQVVILALLQFFADACAEALRHGCMHVRPKIVVHHFFC